jgi:hypothetical protein
MKVSKRIFILIFIGLWLMLEAHALVSQERYSTLTGTVVGIQGGFRKWIDVKGDKDEVTVNFRIGRKTVYIPHRYPYIGEKVKVEYLTEQGANVAYTVTILGESKKSSK